ncbi:cyclin-dependent kinase inhibitor 1C-like [Hetaerina americana]|uniref:cyclin-dependent kinase inhibitor 1C-like n=1 Tax=Hetaerina americana TaxID=62018 RepID=UPI003A7F4D16
MVRRNAVEHLNEMSARVFNAFPLFEMRGTMRGAGVDGFTGDRRSRIRTNLFGPVDHDEVKRALNNELAEQAKRDSKKYNFNFLEEKPTEEGGRYAWDVASAVPAPYELRGMPFIHSHTAEEAGRAVGSSSTAASELCAAPAGAAASMAAHAKAPPVPTAAAFKQSRMTDYHQKRKRLLTQDKAPASPAPSASGQTLFKKARVQES